MSELATMMLRAGLMSQEDAARAQSHSVDRRVTFVEGVLELDLADENGLVAFFHSKLIIPCVSQAVLERVGVDPANRIPSELAWQHTVLPVSTDQNGNLTLAMADPTDLRAVQAVVAHTSGYLVRAVAPLSPLRRAIERCHGRPVPVIDPEATAPGLPISSIAADLASLDRAEHKASSSGTDSYGDEPRDTQPRLPAEAMHELEPEPLSADAFGRVLPRLVASSSRDQITEVVLDFLGAGFRHVILFIHMSDELQGREARGEDLLVDAVRRVRIPTTGESIFARVIANRKPYFGLLLGDTPINVAFSKALGGVAGNVLLLPVVLKGRVPMLVYAAGSNYPVDPRSVQELADCVSLALERLIIRRKTGPQKTVD